MLKQSRVLKYISPIEKAYETVISDAVTERWENGGTVQDVLTDLRRTGGEELCLTIGSSIGRLAIRAK